MSANVIVLTIDCAAYGLAVIGILVGMPLANRYGLRKMERESKRAAKPPVPLVTTQVRKPI